MNMCVPDEVYICFLFFSSDQLGVTEQSIVWLNTQTETNVVNPSGNAGLTIR